MEYIIRTNSRQERTRMFSKANKWNLLFVQTAYLADETAARVPLCRDVNASVGHGLYKASDLGWSIRGA